MKIFLGIHVGQNASATLMIDGRIKLALQEERFTNIKNFNGFPVKSLNYINNYVKSRSLKINKAGFSTHNQPIFWYKYPISHFFSIKEYHDFYGDKFYSRKIKGQNVQSYFNFLLRDKRFKNYKCIYSNLKNKDIFSKFGDYKKISKDSLKKIFGSSIEQITFIDHHTCHAYYGKYSVNNDNNKSCVIVLDSEGDGINQSIWIIDSKKKQLKNILRNSQCDLARIYKLVTLILNMKPDEHEFKIMGMAPYAKKNYYKTVYKKVFQNLLRFENLAIVRKKRPRDLYQFLKKELMPYRFDNIAGALQYYLEITVQKLLLKINRKYGIKNFYFSGGVSMNVKMYNTFIKSRYISKIFNAPSGTDESLSLGVCYYLNHKNKSYPLTNLSLGLPVVGRKQSLKKILKLYFDKNYKLIYNVKPQQIAKLLSKNEIIALVNGQEEFGARALGNRSIIANPSNFENVKQINEFIKNRDFWMPFALTLKDSKQKKYLINPKNLKSYYMNLSFDTKKQYFHGIAAGCHPYDKTVRPQFLRKEQNEIFYNIIHEFSKITKIDALLNTSLNLHGYPKCSDIKNIIKTFKSSGLKYLYIEGNILVKRKT